MDTFFALSEPTRRTILEILAREGELSATQIYRNFPASAPAISQHLKVLRDAHLVEVQKRAQKRIYTVNVDAILELRKWTQTLTERWEDRFSRLDAILEKEKKQAHKRNRRNHSPTL